MYMKLQTQLKRYLAYLAEMERAPLTIQKYRHDIMTMLQGCGAVTAEQLSKEKMVAYKHKLQQNAAATTVNAAIAAVNGFLKYIGREDCCVRPLRVQRMAFRSRQRELSRSEYQQLLRVAERRSQRTACMLETICSTGIRGSEPRHITVEAVACGSAVICNKGKVRTVLLPDRLCAHLQAYCREAGIDRGAIFLGKTGKPLHRGTVWRELKSLCTAARVEADKVFPHNFRHLFAAVFYRMQRDLEHLASILGHSNINTTRIYTQTSSQEHRRQINALMLTR